MNEPIHTQRRHLADLPQHVKIVEVGPRDGLQAERDFVPTAVKIALIDQLARAGIQNVESAAFVSPKWVPQMADGAQVMSGITRRQGTLYSALVPNMRGFELALENQVDEIVIFSSASEQFVQKNINCSIAESLERFKPVVNAAREAGLRVRGSISCSFGCPYEGAIPVSAVADMVKRLRDLHCDEIDLADTIGVGTAGHVADIVCEAARHFDISHLAGHFHDTYGQALANIVSALQAGMTIFHSSVAGLGGCPFAKGATGNVATEDVLYLLNGLGIETGIDLDQILSVGQFVSRVLGRESGSRVGRALHARRQASIAVMGV